MPTPSATRVTTLALAAAAVVALVHQATHAWWFIDDAAISFAYARNWAMGEGLVAVPGGERIEGYSNPTWVVLLALFELVGLSGFVIAKPMAAVFSIGCLMLVHRIAIHALPGRPYAALLAPFALALNAQFALWSASALENSLFCFLLALGIERVLHEREHGGVPWSSVAFLALAWTRPEGLMYAALGGAWFLLFTLRERRSLGGVAAWLGLFWVPYALLEALRLWYFAWPLANTYYAKVGVQGSYPLSWNGRGWGQAREFADRLWHGWLLPIYLLPLIGTHRWRKWVYVVVTLLLAMLLLYPGPERLALQIPWWPEGLPVGPRFFKGRILLLGAVGALLPFLALGRPGGDARAITAHMAAASLFFAVYANGDWMGGFRWMSLLSPTLSILFAVGVAELADVVEGWLGERRSDWSHVGWTTATLALCTWIPPNFNQTRDHYYFNHDETPFMVKRRGDYTSFVAARTFYEGEVVNLEMDQGAHMWWYPEYREVDMAGLIDIPMSRHRYDQRRFIEEYVFDEQRPTFGHVHGNWAFISGFKTYEDWHPTYVEMPRYPDPPLGRHDGVWARRDLFVHDRYDGPADRGVMFAEGVELVGFDVPAEAWSVGHFAFVEVAFRTRHPRRDELQPMLFVRSGDWLHTVQLGLDRHLYPLSEWDPDDVYVGGVVIPLPDDVPTGPLELGFAVLGPDGRVLPAGGYGDAHPLPSSATTAGPVFARGEVRFPGLVEVVSTPAAELAEASLEEVRSRAAAGSCEQAERAWIVAKRHLPADPSWAELHRTGVGAWLAACWAGTVDGAEESVAIDALVRSHYWDHHSPELAEAGQALGESLWRRGLEARDAGDYEAAYRAFTQLLSFQPWRAWARRYAEEARDERLDLRGLDED
jgi:hypothetical protein